MTPPPCHQIQNWGGVFKRLRILGIDSKESIPPAFDCFEPILFFMVTIYPTALPPQY